MATQTIYQEDIPVTGGEHKAIEMTLRYNRDRKAFILSAQPLTRRKHNGFISSSYTPTDGFQQTISTVGRYSAKAAKEAEAEARKHHDEMIETICNRDGYTLVKEGGNPYGN